MIPESRQGINAFRVLFVAMAGTIMAIGVQSAPIALATDTWILVCGFVALLFAHAAAFPTPRTVIVAFSALGALSLTRGVLFALNDRHAALWVWLLISELAFMVFIRYREAHR